MQGIGFGMAAALAATLVPGVSRAAEDQVRAPVPVIDWQACTGAKQFRCATVAVPLDYDNPGGAKILLDLLKVPAARPSTKIGTLFINPGGPGGSSTGFAPMASILLGSTVRNRYDVIGIDPRGVGASTPMKCVSDVPRPPGIDYLFPMTWAQAKPAFIQAQWTRWACADQAVPIVRHMSTADTARDMDLMRQAVGEKKLNYYGISYGTQLGSTYASMFPSRVGRFVVDGVLDPIAWSTGDVVPAVQPFSTRLRSAKGAHEALMSALEDCDRVGRAKCDFAGNASGKWQRLVTLAKAGKLTAYGSPLSYAELIGGVLGSLYATRYVGLDSALQEIWEESAGSGARASASAVADLRAAGERVRKAPYATPLLRGEVVSDAFSGVACSDTRNPDSVTDWWRAGVEQDTKYPGFGSLWTWASASCSKWPIVTKSDSYFRPYGGATATPILVVGNTYDPATPIHGARKVASLFTGARLLTYDGWGHGAIGTGCVTRAFDRYYATGALPPVGAVCPMDSGLWDGDAG